MGKARESVLVAAGREVVITNPDKIFFPKAGYTKLDLATYYTAVADGALRGIAGRPIVLKRYVDGADAEPFFQKRAPEQRPDWIETVELRFPSGRAARGAGPCPRGGAARARPREQQVVEGRAPRRLPRLQPERQGSDGGLGVVGAADARRARVHATRLGRGGRLRSGGLHADHRAVTARAAWRCVGRHRRCGRLARFAARALGLPGGGGPRRCAVAAALPQAARRATARRAVTPQSRRDPRDGREGGAQGGCARRPRALEGAASGRGGTAARRRRPDRFDARAIDHLDAHPRQSPPRPAGRAPGAGTARPRLRSLVRARARAGAEDSLELVGRRDLQLIVAAVLGTLVEAPAHELRGVPEARALHVVVGDLADALGTQRLPAQILAAIPPAGRAGHALPRSTRFVLRVGPLAPGVTL